MFKETDRLLLIRIDISIQPNIMSIDFVLPAENTHQLTMSEKQKKHLRKVQIAHRTKVGFTFEYTNVNRMHCIQKNEKVSRAGGSFCSLFDSVRFFCNDARDWSVLSLRIQSNSSLLLPGSRRRNGERYIY